MDDTFVIQKEEHKQNFLEHINNVDPAIKFTVEDNKENGAIPFLDAIVKPEADNTLSITVYRKPTHTDQYLQWDSHHHLSTKNSAINTLTHRAGTVCSKLELLLKEMGHLRKALSNCKYPRWTGWTEDSHSLPGRKTAVPTLRTLLALSPPPLKPRPWATLSYLTPRAYVKA